MRKKNIHPLNDAGEFNGYCEIYYDNGQLDYKGVFINGREHGYQESYFNNGRLFYKGLIINDKFVGYVERTSSFDSENLAVPIPIHYKEFYI